MLTNSVLVPGKVTPPDVTSMASFNGSTGAVERQQQLTYFDGLGRPVQQVQVQASPSRQDLVVPIVYDALGRTPTTYLPYTTGGGGAFQPTALSQQAAFYQVNGVLDHVVNDAVPSAQQLIERSPLGRLLEQGAPGATWQPGTRHTVKLNQRSNLAGEVRQWNYDDTASPACTSSQTYAPGQLLVKETRDEQGGLVTEYVDKAGKTVLRKVAGAGVTCQMQIDWNTLTLQAPPGMGFVGIRSATYGRLLTGTTCDDAQFDVAYRADVTAAVKNMVASQLSGSPAPNTLSFVVDYRNLMADPYPGYGKSLLVEALYAPIQAPINRDLQTCYVYDNLDNLRVVIQPQGYADYALASPYSSLALTDNFLAAWCFRYDYDGRHRVIRKQVPGAGPQLFVYNQRDQIVLSQDGNQTGQSLSLSQWTFTKYDVLDRPILTGTIYSNETQAALQAKLDQETILCETRDPSSDLGYSLLNAYPRLSGYGQDPLTTDNLLTIEYYDDYSYSRLATTGQLTCSLPAGQTIPRADGLVTGTSVRVVGPSGPTTQWLTSATYYDKQYRPVQSAVQNQLGGVTVTTSTYDFAKLLSTSTTQSTSAGPTYAQANHFTYGAANRLEATYQNTGSQGDIILSHQTYNELGQLISKRLHNAQPPAPPASLTSTKFVQKVDYRYNIRGWLTHLNNRDLDNNSIEDSPGVYVSDPDGTAAEPDLFGMELRYDNMLHGDAKPQFNGNIAQQMWQTRSPDPNKAQNNVLRTYNYTYDPVNRIAGAEYKIWNNYTFISNPAVDFSVSGISYDYNGNLLTMNRKGTINNDNTNPVSGVLDQLKYTYGYTSSSTGQYVTGNRLLAVDDAAPSNPGSTHDFKDNGQVFASSNQPEYQYDSNGNLTSDANKGTSGIKYNLLNQPTSIFIAYYNRIEYSYTATGTKLQKRIYTLNNLVKTTDYVGSVVYETVPNGTPVLQFAQTGEGRVLYLPSNNAPLSWKYEYHLKDHLGNLRFAFRADKDNGTVTQLQAGMESVNAPKEEAQFQHVAETRLADPDHARTGSYVARLDAHTGRRDGPSVRVKVAAGDSIRAEAYGRYDRGTVAGNLLQKGALVAGSLTTGVPGQVETDQRQLVAPRRRWLPFVGASMGIIPQLLHVKRAELPVAYLRYEVFNKDSQLVFTKQQPIQRTATDEWQQLQAGTKIDSAGFVQVSLVNESGVPAYFDDLAVSTVAPTPYQENHYDPFGLNLVGIETADVPNSAFQYNGKEKQEDFRLNWLDYGARMYDSQLGRWNSVDPLADKWNMISPYSYALDNPLLFLDPDGRDNIVYLQVQQSAYKDFTRKELRGAVNQANANFKHMGLETRVRLARGQVNYSKLDRTDAVAVIGRGADVISAVGKMSGAYANELKTDGFGKNGSNLLDDAQHGGNIIPLDSKAIAETAPGWGETKSALGGFVINHGAGHNAGLQHGLMTQRLIGGGSMVVPELTMMADGTAIQDLKINYNWKVSELIAAPDNIDPNGLIYGSFTHRFGNHPAHATLPTTE
ncbi:DUF6443 domain-containing protein [Hymenobacter sp. H14-R3]|uniref:DUF6443 domain-containing protein n=1 Tax=Hymenobacter sp. H14-R3 TaxID=3046308 RepID=UPI0024B8C2BA|nr:DUF6443 domain-containing protein [Hymenobacter sp. H14-R3]MDJ0367970.1 DUF6443 domain-containing protein [Hymenobacter sp. H14-R3]